MMVCLWLVCSHVYHLSVQCEQWYFSHRPIDVASMVVVRLHREHCIKMWRNRCQSVRERKQIRWLSKQGILTDEFSAYSWGKVDFHVLVIYAQAIVRVRVRFAFRIQWTDGCNYRHIIARLNRTIQIKIVRLQWTFIFHICHTIFAIGRHWGKICIRRVKLWWEKWSKISDTYTQSHHSGRPTVHRDKRLWCHRIGPNAKWNNRRLGTLLKLDRNKRPQHRTQPVNECKNKRNVYENVRV